MAESFPSYASSSSTQHLLFFIFISYLLSMGEQALRQPVRLGLPLEAEHGDVVALRSGGGMLAHAGKQGINYGLALFI